MPESTTTGIERSGEGAALLRSNLIVASGTALSRITGLLRVMVFGYVIGKGALADVYLIGNETPNIVYELLIGGVLSATLVPLFTEFLDRDDEEATNAVITVALTAMAVLTALAVLAAPLIFGLYTVRTQEGVDPDLIQRVGTLLTRVFLLQIFFYGAAGVANAVLNSRATVPRRLVESRAGQRHRHRHAAVAAGPDLAAGRRRGRRAAALDAGYRLDRRHRGDGARAHSRSAIGGPALPTGVPTAPPGDPATADDVAVDVRLRARATRRSSSSCATCRHLDRGDRRRTSRRSRFSSSPMACWRCRSPRRSSRRWPAPSGAATARRSRATSSLGLRIIAVLTVPAAIVLFVLRRPLIGLLLQHGEYTATDALVTSRALAGFALGLPAFSVYLFALRGFYAHQDTRTPFVINAGQCILNVVFALMLYGRWGVLGLGAAFALSYALAALWSSDRAGDQGARLSVAPGSRVDRSRASRRGARR